MNSNDQLITVEEAADTLRVSVITVRRWLASGKLKAKRAGRRLLIDPADVKKILEPHYRIVRGAPLLPGVMAPLTDRELTEIGTVLVSFLRVGGWPIDLLPITAETLRPVLLDETQAGPIFWRTLARAIASSREKKPSRKETKRLSDAFDAWASGKGKHPFREA